VNTTNSVDVQDALDDVGELLFNLSATTLVIAVNESDAGTFNGTELVDDIKNFTLNVARALDNNTQRTIASADGSTVMIVSKGTTDCTPENEGNKYAFTEALNESTVDVELPGSCSDAYGGGGGSIGATLLSSTVLHDVGLQGFAIGDTGVLMFKIDGYVSGTPFAPGQFIRYTVPIPAGELAPEPCRFLNTSGEEPVWSSAGCTSDLGLFSVTCRCNHATSFAVLVAGDSSSSGNSASDTAINVISYIGVCISMVCFVVMLGLYLFFANARQERNKRILMHIILMLFFTMLLFLLGSLAGPTKLGADGCTAVAALLQYSLLAAFSWMLAEGHLLLKGISNPFSAARLKTITAYTVLAYGTPLVYVVTIVAIYTDEFGEQPSGVCYISDTILPTVYVPIAIIGMFNLYVFVRVWQAILGVPKSRRRSSLQTWRSQMKINAFKSMSLLTVLGLTWLVGLLFLTGDNVFWEWPFIFLNAFQGLIIFVTHCVNDHDLRVAISDYMRTRRLSRSSRSNSRGSRGSGRTSAERRRPLRTTEINTAQRPTFWGQHATQPRKSGEERSSTAPRPTYWGKPMRPVASQGASTARRVPSQGTSATHSTDADPDAHKFYRTNVHQREDLSSVV
jgi:hypothetical protein